MGKVTPALIDLYDEEISAGSPTRSSTMQRIAASVNFWNTYYEGHRGWFLNGPYGVMGTPQYGVDGAYGLVTNMMIYGITVYNLEAGSSGVTEFDVKVIPPSGSSFSIFSTRPKIPHTSGNNARIIMNLTTSTTLAASSGVTLPVFSTTDLSAGCLLTLDLISAQTNGKSAGLILSLRPKD